MSVADKYKTEGGSEGGSFISSSDLDKGMALTVVSMEEFTPENSQYGISNTYAPGGVLKKEHWFVEKSILKEGESFRYTFKSGDEERTFENSSLGFYFAFTNLNPNGGDEIWIKRQGNPEDNFDVKWTVETYHDQNGVTSEEEQEAMDNPME